MWCSDDDDDDDDDVDEDDDDDLIWSYSDNEGFTQNSGMFKLGYLRWERLGIGWQMDIYCEHIVMM